MTNRTNIALTCLLTTIEIPCLLLFHSDESRFLVIGCFIVSVLLLRDFKARKEIARSFSAVLFIVAMLTLSGMTFIHENAGGGFMFLAVAGAVALYARKELRTFLNGYTVIAEE